MKAPGWLDGLKARFGDLDIDIRIGTSSGELEATTSGATGKPGISWNGQSASVRLGDYQLNPLLVLGGAALAVYALLK